MNSILFRVLASKTTNKTTAILARKQQTNFIFSKYGIIHREPTTLVNYLIATSPFLTLWQIWVNWIMKAKVWDWYQWILAKQCSIFLDSWRRFKCKVQNDMAAIKQELFIVNGDKKCTCQGFWHFTMVRFREIRLKSRTIA